MDVLRHPTLPAALVHHPHLASLRRLLDGVGEPVWAGYDTSAALFGFDGFALAPPFHLVVPRERNIARVGHVVHSSRDIEPIDCESIGGVPCMSPTRTVLQLASSTTPDRLRIALAGAVRDGLTSEDFLHRRLAALRASGRSGVTAMIAALEHHEFARGGTSWLEAEFLRLIRRARLPRPESQVVLGRRRDRIIRVDFRFPGTRLVVETLGYRWHRTTAQMAIDAERMSKLAIDGFVVVQFTYDQVVREATYVVDTVRAALAAARSGVPATT